MPTSTPYALDRNYRKWLVWQGYTLRTLGRTYEADEAERKAKELEAQEKKIAARRRDPPPRPRGGNPPAAHRRASHCYRWQAWRSPLPAGEESG